MSKVYKQGIKRNIGDVFRIQVINSNSWNRQDRDIKSPILTLGSTSFIYRQLEHIWICAVTRSNQDCTTILEFLIKFEPLLKVLCEAKTLTEEKITNNFVTIYELLDVVIEFGFPINLELNYVKNQLTTSNNEKTFKLPKVMTMTKDKPEEVKKVSSVSWRSEGIMYRRNEIFLNVEEKVNVLVNYNSELLRGYVDGKINMKTHLSGMPECRFGFTDNVDLRGNNGDVNIENTKFHQCVQLNRFDANGAIQFIPPDGEFQLMSYHVKLGIILPFKVYPKVEIYQLKISYDVRIKSTFPRKLPANNVVLKIPTPKGVGKTEVSSVSGGKCKFFPEENAFLWKFSKFQGDQEYRFSGQVEITSDTVNSINKPPIKLDFNLDMYNCSGLTVKFLKVNEKLNYRTVKWVKYITQSGSYEIRY